MIKSLLQKLFGGYLVKKAALYDGTPTVGKAWWKSKTVLAGIVVTLRGLYEGASSTMVLAGKPPLPPIPASVDAFLGIVLGGAVVQGRVSANQPIVIDESLNPKNQTK